MADSRCWSRDFLSEFLNEYRLHPCLWKLKSKEYSNKYLRNAAYDKLVVLCKDRFPEADRAFVTKKIQSLRGCFRKELKRVTDSTRSGSSADDKYLPTLWYYDLLLFTKDQETPSSSLTNRATDEGRPPLELDDEEDVLFEDFQPGPTRATEDVARNQSQVDRDFQPSPPKVSKSKVNSLQKELLAVAQKLTEGPAVQPPDKWEAYAISVAGDLRTMNDQQQTITQKLISEAIFYGKMGSLTAGASVSPSNPLPHYPRYPHYQHYPSYSRYTPEQDNVQMTYNTSPSDNS